MLSNQGLCIGDGLRGWPASVLLHVQLFNHNVLSLDNKLLYMHTITDELQQVPIFAIFSCFVRFIVPQVAYELSGLVSLIAL